MRFAFNERLAWVRNPYGAGLDEVTFYSLHAKFERARKNITNCSVWLVDLALCDPAIKLSHRIESRVS